MRCKKLKLSAVLILALGLTGLQAQEAVTEVDIKKVDHLCLDIAMDKWSDEINESLTDQFLVILGVDKNDPDVVSKVQKAWIEKRNCITCTSEFFDYETGDSYLISLIRNAFRESRRDWVSQLIKTYKLDINYYEQREMQDGVYVTPLDYLQRVAEYTKTRDQDGYQDLLSWIETLRKQGAKYCWEIPECPQNN